MIFLCFAAQGTKALSSSCADRLRSRKIGNDPHLELGSIGRAKLDIGLKLQAFLKKQARAELRGSAL
jgi:hypothetical protein